MANEDNQIFNTKKVGEDEEEGDPGLILKFCQ